MASPQVSGRQRGRRRFNSPLAHHTTTRSCRSEGSYAVERVAPVRRAGTSTAARLDMRHRCTGDPPDPCSVGTRYSVRWTVLSEAGRLDS